MTDVIGLASCMEVVLHLLYTSHISSVTKLLFLSVMLRNQAKRKGTSRKHDLIHIFLKNNADSIRLHFEDVKNAADCLLILKNNSFICIDDDSIRLLDTPAESLDRVGKAIAISKETNIALEYFQSMSVADFTWEVLRYV